MVDIVQFGITCSLGLALIFMYIYKKVRWKQIMSSGDRTKCYGVIHDINQKLRRGPDATGYVYRLLVKYRTNTGEEIISLSRNTIHSPKDYVIGEPIEISYDLRDPKSFYICNDRNRQTSNRFILVCGLFLCVMGAVFILSPKFLT